VYARARDARSGRWRSHSAAVPLPAVPRSGGRVHERRSEVMRRCLAVVEKAYRGAIEEQYAHILWICWSLVKMGQPLGILLRHRAVLYGRRDQRRASLSVADVAVHLPDHEESIIGLIRSGGSVFVVDSDLAAFDLAPASLCRGVTTVGVRDLPQLLDRY